MLLGFKKQFRAKILFGTKVFTLRKKRKSTPKIGERLYMYTGLRTANCEKITDKETLRSIQKVKLYLTNRRNNKDTGESGVFIEISVDNRRLTFEEIEQFVVFDGFYSTYDFFNYWMTESGRKKGKRTVAGGFFDLFHWTDLRF